MGLTETERSQTGEQPWAAEAAELLARLEVDPATGLSTDAAERRLSLHGPNSIGAVEQRGWPSILADQFKGLLVLLLAGAALLSALFGQWLEALAILVVLLLNAVIGFVTELRAVRSVEALRKLGATHASVRREGRLLRVNAEELVPGDVLLVEAGDLVGADARVLRASRLEADESSLTGESVPVAKGAAAVPAGTVLPERASMLHMGTPVTRGAAEAVVVATGSDTQLGRVSRLVEGVEDETTPLERRLSELARRLVWLTLIVAMLVTLTGLGSGKEWLVLLQTAIALAVATVPEGLPIIATLTLARGVNRMAKRNALVNRLSAIETLGATSVVLTDKTGTLTENRMRAVTLSLPAGEVELDAAQPPGRAGGSTELDEQRLRALTVAALCATAELPPEGQGEGEEDGVGDPMELALLRAAREAGLERPALLERHPELAQAAFDPDTRLMATAHEWEEGTELIAVKGAPGAVLAATTRIHGAEGPASAAEKEAWLQRNRELAARGLRVLAVAERTVPAGTAGAGEEQGAGGPYRDLTLVGLVGLVDPPREGMSEVIERFGGAGIRVVMATGDQAVTAASIARQVGIPGADRVLGGEEVSSLLAAAKGDDAAGGESAERLLAANVLARVAPEQKLDLVELHQGAGNVVAMTGDGVNDAPALRRADIGVAMGRRGTEVAREAADMVLLDDAFGTIIAAVKEGRVIFDNIRAFVLFLLSCNLSEILSIGIAGLIGYPLPLLPLQILFLNLITDVFPALALGTGRGDSRVLERPPRPHDEPLLAARHWRSVVGYGGLLTATTLTAFVVALRWYETPGAVTVAFLSLALGQVWHVFNMRDPGTPLLVNQVTRNPWVWAATLGCTALLVLVVVVPPLREVLSIVLLDARGWWLVIAAGLAPLLLGQAGKALSLGRIS